MFFKLVLSIVCITATIFVLENILPKLKSRKKKKQQKAWNDVIKKLEIR